MKRAFPFALLFAALLLCLALPAAADTPLLLPELGVSTAFPDGWTVVTPETASDHADLLKGTDPSIFAETMKVEDVYAVAFSSSGDARLRLIIREGDETEALYYDIERYTTAMRSEIKDYFMDKDNWSDAGVRYSAAEWTNKKAEGRLLRLTYSVRQNDEIVSRGRQAFTVRGGMAFTLELIVTGRQVESKDEKALDALIAATAFPSDAGMPPLPVGLTVTGGIPEEASDSEIKLKGETMKGATVTARLQQETGAVKVAGSVKANASGLYSITVTLPSAGDFMIYLTASMDGYADTIEGGWVTYTPGKLPVTFTSLPEGDVTDSQIIISGKTLPNVSIQCMEGDTNKKKTTGSDGKFSFTLDRAIVGERTVVLSMTKKGYDNRRVNIQFNRVLTMADTIKILKESLQSLSYKNLDERGPSYAGRRVSYTGTVIDLSSYGDRHYVQMALSTDKSGDWQEGMVAIWEGGALPLAIGDRVTVYVEVTGDTYGYSRMTAKGDLEDLNLPSLKLLAYEVK